MAIKSELGAFILRITMGIIFFCHGLAKVQGGMDGVVDHFSRLGLPGFLAYIVTYVELIGGIALIIGLGTRLVSVLLALIMMGAIFKVKLAAGILGNGQTTGYDLNLSLLAMSVYFIINGSYLFSIDQWILKKDNIDNFTKSA